MLLVEIGDIGRFGNHEAGNREAMTDPFFYHVSPPPRGGHAPSARRISAICPM